MFPLQKSDNNTKYIENYRLVTLVNIDIKILKSTELQREGQGKSGTIKREEENQEKVFIKRKGGRVIQMDEEKRKMNNTNIYLFLCV